MTAQKVSKAKLRLHVAGNVAKVEIDLAGICALKLVGRTLSVSVTNPAATRRFVGYECVLNHVVLFLSTRVLCNMTNCNGCIVGTKVNSVNGKRNCLELTLVRESAQVQRSTYWLAGERLT
jgi:hypothetical protein